MKYNLYGMMIALALALALVLGVAALAENPAPEAAQPPAVEATVPEATQPDADAADDAEAATDDNAALEAAFRAYSEARTSTRQEALEDELNGYVESGKLTQEQADLILNYYKEREAQRNGTCPNCGYQLRDGQGKGGRMNNGMNGKCERMGNGFGGGMNGNRFGTMNGNGFGGKGGRGMMGQQPTDNQNANGAAQLPGLPAMPGTNGF